MIRRLFVLVLFSIIVIGGSASLRPTQSAGPAPCAQDHAAWLTQVLEKMETIKPGMTRWDLLRVFRTESTRRTFTMGVSQDSPNFKIDVEFEPSFGVLKRNRQGVKALRAIHHNELEVRPTPE